MVSAHSFNFQPKGWPTPPTKENPAVKKKVEQLTLLRYYEEQKAINRLMERKADEIRFLVCYPC